MKVKKCVLIFFCSLLSIFVFSQKKYYIIEFYVDSTKHQIETDIDTLKTIFFINNQRVHAIEVIKGVITESVEWYLGSSSVRRTLLMVGEKYRNFEVNIYMRRKKDEKNDESN